MISARRNNKPAGFTLIELMVAMVLGLLVSAGIITVFLSTSASNRAQKQMQTIQEAGRFAMRRIREDVSMANGQYCSSSGGAARDSDSGVLLDDLRAPVVFASKADQFLKALDPDSLTTQWGNPYPPTPTQAFAIPAFLSMRGYDCTASTCTPMDPADAGSSKIPDMGTAPDDRVPGAAVLTVRYLDPNMGWRVGLSGGTQLSATGNTLDAISISPLDINKDKEPEANFKTDDLAMLADCSYSQVFSVNASGSTLTPDGNFDTINSMQGATDLRLFNFNHAYKTVTYYLKVVPVHENKPDGPTTGALMRRALNKQGEYKAHELARGIERLDFRYGIQDSDGNTRFLTAAEVEAQSTDANCPFEPPNPAIGDPPPRTGCLWRAVKSIEVNMLVDGQMRGGSLSKAMLAYTYGPDGDFTPALPDTHDIKPKEDQGFPKQMMRREFTGLIALRNYNP